MNISHEIKKDKKMNQTITRFFLMLGIIIFANLIMPPQAVAQNKNLQLADEYFQKKEYEKANSLYEKLSLRTTYLQQVYTNYLASLLAQKQFKDAEKLIKRRMRIEPENPTLPIDYGFVLERQGKIGRADKQFERVVNDVRKKPDHVVSAAAEHFVLLDKATWAEKIYLNARRGIANKYLFAQELANVYATLGKFEPMIDEYINVALDDRKNLESVKGALQDRLTTQKDLEKFEKILLTKLQKQPGEIIYNEFLLWIYLQQKLFYRAFIQAKALDRRYRQEGSELLNIGMIAMRNEDYKNAKRMFAYVVKKYPKGSNYSVARHYLIKAKEAVVKNTYPVARTDIESLIGDYSQLLKDLGRNFRTLNAMRSIALLQAFYLDKKDTAVVTLKDAIKLSGYNQRFIAQCRLDLGDIYILKGEPWEATLLYSQVEKTRKRRPLGYEAKLRNGKLSYFKGDFELAQGHLDILKEATTREIANDAMNLSLLIRDNTALDMDTTNSAMKAYAGVELLMFQHKDKEALDKLVEMEKKYKDHSLKDEILWSKSKLLLKMAKFQETIEVLEQIVKQHGQDILADDAHFTIGKIYEEYLKNPEKAKEYYRNHLTKFPGSIYVVEARKRFRIIRGDFKSLEN
ncbi:tetratricopeptide repeat domain protein [Microscilla marina ATCC 23134]|uniref:Tetratricopeptide repeat domain protein n=2 Tax=Microscilla marina TaxID=1027 RepID=A1ZGE4_MICM2|nr:tetratricopeptide repeat domain protein [Microscilla marina ATCC 23134]